MCAAALLWMPAASRADTAEFPYTPGNQTWTVPAGVYLASFDLYGAQGGSGPCLTFSGSGCSTSAGGLGARLQALIAVTPGQIFQIRTGGAGGNGFEATGTTAGTTGAGTAGFNGGAAGGAGAFDGFNANGSGGGGGGGATDVRTGTYTLAERVLVAAGGGGGGAGGRGSILPNPMAPCAGHSHGGFSGGAGGSSGSDGSAGGYGNATPGLEGGTGAGGTGGTGGTPGGGTGGTGGEFSGGSGGAGAGASTAGGGGGAGGLYAAGGGGGGASSAGTQRLPRGHNLERLLHRSGRGRRSQLRSLPDRHPDVDLTATARATAT